LDLKLEQNAIQMSGMISEHGRYSNLRLSIIVPAYNEERRINRTLEILTQAFSEDLPNQFELVVIMDGCTDRTHEVVTKIAENIECVIPYCFHNRLGKGGAIINALRYARGEALLLIDADLPTSTYELRKLVSLMRKYDLVFGSRYAKNSRILIKEPLFRILLSRGFNVLVKMLFWRLRGVRDTQCGVKVIKREALEKIKKDLFITDFAFDVNLIYATLRYGFRVKEVGIEWRHDETESKLSKEIFKASIKMFASIIRLRIYYSRFRKLLKTRFAKRIADFIYRL